MLLGREVGFDKICCDLSISSELSTNDAKAATVSDMVYRPTTQLATAEVFLGIWAGQTLICLQNP